MVQGLDYSFSHPDLTCVRNTGYTFVARYIGDPDPNSAKYLDAPELAAIRAAGLSVVVVRETTAGFMLTESGAVHARASRNHCNQLGLFGIPIYYALDVDPRTLSASQINAVTLFLKDAAGEDGGGNNVGLYAGYAGIERWVGTASCRWGWQTYAWSAGRISSKAHFRQYLNGQSICGGTVDLNETYASDYGQWPRPNTPEVDVTPEQAAQLNRIEAAVYGQTVGELGRQIWAVKIDDLPTLDGAAADMMRKILNASTSAGDIDEAAVAAEVLAVLTPEAIAAAIPDELAEEVANELHARLAD